MLASPFLAPCIGVFDSGLGGLSVLRALRARLPSARLVYVADSAYAPYGERSPGDVLERSLRLTAHLARSGARMIVVACNTATALAIDQLRAQWPDLAFIGVEPGIKPAAAITRNGRIGVLATPATLASARLRGLMERHAHGVAVQLQACPGLAAAIERGDTHDSEIGSLLERYCAPLRDGDVDTLVLGCTHYPFVAARIQLLMGPNVTLVDTAEPVAARAAALWSAERDAAQPTPWLQTTGDALLLADVAARWLGWTADADPVLI
jgi:glutamate racemase